MAAKDCLWLIEATRGTYPSLTAMNYFGIEPEGSDFTLTIPNVIEVNTNKTMGTRTATFTKGNTFPENITARFKACNGLPEYLMLGDSTTAASVHTITAHATQIKPSISVFRQGYTATEKKKAAGLVCKQLSISYKGGTELLTSMSFDGMTDAVSTDTPTSNVFPSNRTDPFVVLTAFTIAGAAYSLDVSGIELSISQDNQPYGNNAGKRRGINDTNVIVTTVVANVVGDLSALRTAADAGTPVIMILKVSTSDGTYYKQYTCTMLIYDISDKLVYNDAVDRAVISMVGSGISVAVKDGVADAFYGD